MTSRAVHDSRDASTPKIHFFGEVTSTLDEALKLAEEGRLDIWDSVVAKTQSEGRGQMRRHWDSPPGNLYATLRLPPTPPFNTTAASVAIGALCANALRSFGCPVKLKWPNDLVVNKDGSPAKLGGILLEERNGCLLAGIGINISVAPGPFDMREAAALPAGDLVCGNGKKILPTPDELWRALLRHIYTVYKNSQAFPRIWREAADELLLWRGEPVEMQDSKREIKGILLGVGSAGGALLEINGNVEEAMTGSMWPVGAREPEGAAVQGKILLPGRNLEEREI